jgi:hypothetical protein
LDGNQLLLLERPQILNGNHGFSAGLDHEHIATRGIAIGR